MVHGAWSVHPVQRMAVVLVSEIVGVLHFRCERWGLCASSANDGKYCMGVTLT